MTGDDSGSQPAIGRGRVLVSNRQRRVPVRADRLRRTALRVLRAAHPEGGELSLLLVDDATIARLNADYRGKPRPTDVLSFPQLDATPRPEARSGPEASRPRSGPPRMIGDVVISVETARRQARARGRPLDEELGALLVHGVLHLLGHDHERSAADARLMFAREREVAAAVGLPPLALGEPPGDARVRARGRARRPRRGEA